MNIEEIREDEAKNQENGEDRTQWVREDIYEFKYLDRSLFKNISNKDTEELLTKWGLPNEKMELCKFRFNQGFNLFNTDRFIRDLLNSQEFRTAMPRFSGCLPQKVDSIEYDKLSTEVVNMGFFDVLVENDITTENGYIKKEPDEYVFGKHSL